MSHQLKLLFSACIVTFFYSSPVHADKVKDCVNAIFVDKGFDKDKAPTAFDLDFSKAKPDCVKSYLFTTTQKYRTVPSWRHVKYLVETAIKNEHPYFLDIETIDTEQPKAVDPWAPTTVVTPEESRPDCVKSEADFQLYLKGQLVCE